ncbi:helix-turn-helix transcriptional regulator [Aestuariivirga sp.]|jgi:predicted DNA-binding transcriptional regulator AlpA|uniref:helix-turn-helix transcriptional regulator n=1 Tax=Aestuariivirga sp. TaxID=2650926 RepID=UPI003784BA0A
MTTFLRYRDLEARGIVRSWAALRYKIKHNGFPPGRYLGPNTRAWTAEEVQAWLDALPTENPRRAAAKAPEAA